VGRVYLCLKLWTTSKVFIRQANNLENRRGREENGGEGKGFVRLKSTEKCSLKARSKI
jgi:hypothetical protein